jgi:hypothetical protein
MSQKARYQRRGFRAPSPHATWRMRVYARAHKCLSSDNGRHNAVWTLVALRFREVRHFCRVRRFLFRRPATRKDTRSRERTGTTAAGVDETQRARAAARLPLPVSANSGNDADSGATRGRVSSAPPLAAHANLLQPARQQTEAPKRAKLKEKAATTEEPPVNRDEAERRCVPTVRVARTSGIRAQRTPTGAATSLARYCARDALARRAGSTAGRRGTLEVQPRHAVAVEKKGG